MENEFIETSKKITSFVDSLLIEDGFEGWKLDQFEITMEENGSEIRKKCKWELIKGKLEIVCRTV